MDVYTIISVILGGILLVWGGFKFSLQKILKAGKEFADVLNAANEAYQNDQKFDPGELKNIHQQWNEFIDATGFRSLKKLKR